MWRKLALSGLLQFFRRGTAFQVFCGCAMSFCSCILQVHIQPYEQPEANLLKALVEVQIFEAFLVSFILRVLPRLGSAEPLAAESYGWVLVCSLGALFLVAIGLTARQIWIRRRMPAASSDEANDEIELREGLASEVGGGVAKS